MKEMRIYIYLWIYLFIYLLPHTIQLNVIDCIPIIPLPPHDTLLLHY